MSGRDVRPGRGGFYLRVSRIERRDRLGQVSLVPGFRRVLVTLAALEVLEPRLWLGRRA